MGPYKIIKKLNNHLYQTEINSKVKTINHYYLKKSYYNTVTTKILNQSQGKEIPTTKLIQESNTEITRSAIDKNQIQKKLNSRPLRIKSKPN